MVLAYTYPLLNIFWSMLVLVGMVIWIWVLITIFVDLFRSRDISGWAKAAWLLLVLVLPLVGSLIYLIARGGSIGERSIREAEEQERAFRTYVRDAAGPTGTSTADELSKLSDLADKGIITRQEFEQQKAKLLGTTAEPPDRSERPAA